ncbi:MAG TPA: hypothetical protein VIP48_12525, partial [Streptosporangiaceae bacterium]
LFGLWPAAASALTCLDRRLPLMPRYLAQARAIADALRGVPGVRVIPDPPQTPMMHLLLRTSAASFRAAVIRLAKDQGVWTWPEPISTVDPLTQRVELSVGDQTLAIPPAEAAGIITALAGG